MLPGVVGRVGELEARGCKLDRPRVCKLMEKYVGQLLACADKQELPTLGQKIKESLIKDETLHPDERQLLQSTMFQAYSLQVANIHRREQLAQEREAAAAEKSTWKQAAGRRTGPDGYKFGDFTLAILNKLSLGGRKLPEPDYGGPLQPPPSSFLKKNAKR